MMRIVLDANVIASGFPAPSGVPGQLVVAWLRRDLEVVLSEHILSKVATTWQNPYFHSRYGEQEAQRALALLRRRGTFVVPVSDVRGIAPDDEDDVVLATAVAGRVDFLVTGDNKFRNRVKSYQGIALLSPREFLDLLERKSREDEQASE